jgi:hypothetical protein
LAAQELHEIVVEIVVELDLVEHDACAKAWSGAANVASSAARARGSALRKR